MEIVYRILFIPTWLFFSAVPPVFIEYFLEEKFEDWIGVKPCWFLVKNPDDHPTTFFCFGLSLVFFILTFVLMNKVKPIYSDDDIDNPKARKYLLIFFGGIAALDLLQATIRACWIACFS